MAEIQTEMVINLIDKLRNDLIIPDVCDIDWPNMYRPTESISYDPVKGFEEHSDNVCLRMEIDENKQFQLITDSRLLDKITEYGFKINFIMYEKPYLKFYLMEENKT